MRYLFVLFGLLFTIGLSAQTTVQPVMLQWKIKPGDTLSYRTMMDEVDSVRQGDSLFTKNDTPYKRYMDTSSSDIIRKMRDIVASLDDYESITKLTNTGKQTIDIETRQWLRRDSATKPTDDRTKYFSNRTGSLGLRGSVTENGKITSFYLKNGQKNIVSLFFELPGKPVKPGDTWPLEVQLISSDHTFKCDSSFRKNNVSLMELKKSGKETIAVLRYDIEEFINGTWTLSALSEPRKVFSHVRYIGVAEFSVEKGRWIKYDCVLISNASGYFGRDSIQHFVLQPD